ncbi:AraC-type DNA-binding protein [Clostridium amylolyticum]|uniref:AraC-type DNA-binding protein n=1 Tax=Clostridium amylolyticum TaxID=1121298 RepID=A0A1M6PC64_9CLOT|nr:AraC family transcriptional regulator [Clostridium amylolyticum]SHK05517.1 AraC-type DNA-binding protein [Clostridium amylolyticum]
MDNLLMEELFLEITNKYDSNLIVYQCGWEKCKPKHSYGPAVRDHYLIHFVTKGAGKFYIDNLTFDIKENQGFLICPGDITYYEADEKEPWEYIWVGFNGLKANEYIRRMGLDNHNPIIKTKNSIIVSDYLNNIFKCSKFQHAREVRMLGYLYLLLSILIEEAEIKEVSNYKYEYIEKAIEYIEMNYSRSISVQSIADHVGLNRCYFSSIFKNSLNMSPESFLIGYRINKACELFKQNKNLRIGDVSRSVGYSDQLVFSKVFKKVKGYSPSEYINPLKG